MDNLQYQIQGSKRSKSIKIPIVLLTLVLVFGVAYASWRIFSKSKPTSVSDASEEAIAEPSIQPKSVSKETTTESVTSEPAFQPEPEPPTTDWKTYRNEKYGFEVKYPPHLKKQKTLFRQPFNPGLEGSLIVTFSDEQADELVIAVSQGSLDGYIVRDNPDGVFYRFDQKESRWVSSVGGEVTGSEPSLLDVPFIAYGYHSGDIRCLWQGAVVPHKTDRVVFEIVYVRCGKEGQQLERTTDFNNILSTLRFIDK